MRSQTASRRALRELLEKRVCNTFRGRDIRKMQKPWLYREVVFVCSNGYLIERLYPQDYWLEGLFMGHCMGGPDGPGRRVTDDSPKNFAGYYHLVRPDGTPHVTIHSSYGMYTLHGRGNAWPKQEYESLIREWVPEARFAGIGGWGYDKDSEYHEKGVLTDFDYRDLPAGEYWRRESYDRKRGLREARV